MKNDINVTPFIDVLLVLLIIFMILAPAPPRALDASLPQARGERSTGSNEVVVEVATDGFAVNRTPVWTPAELEARLREALDTRGERRVFVRASGEVAYDRVMLALDAARAAGANRIGMLDPK